jgi:hypothetical protein
VLKGAKVIFAEFATHFSHAEISTGFHVLFAKLLTNEGREGGVEVFVVELVEDFLKEGGDKEAAGGGGGDAAGLKVEGLLGVEAGGGAAVGALHVVGLDFEPGEAVGFGRVGEE